MRVNELAKRMGLSADTVRYYTRIGLLAPDREPANSYKRYGEKQQRRLRFISDARALGFSVDDIRQILEVADNGKTPCPMVRELIELRLGELEERFQHMARLRQRMLEAVATWKNKPDREPTGHAVCHLIEEFSP
ncbi:MerR family transcriptional regulator [Porticoccus sp.]